jgi:hypothetical protein
MRLRRLVIAAGVTVAVCAAGGLIVYAGLRRFTGSGTTTVERWCARQVMAIANAHLGPTLSFDRLGYAYPRTVTLSDIRLTSGDVPIITADALRIEFAEIPRPGRPIVLASVRFQHPVVRLIEQEGGPLLGFSDFVKPGPGTAQPDGGSTRLSDVLAIRRIEVDQGSVQYEQPDRPAMRLRPLSFVLRHDQSVSSDAAPEPGWYGFTASLALEPVVHLDVDARLNLDTAVLDVAKAALSTSLTSAQYTVFTPEIQEVLNRYAIVGDLEWSLSGQVPLDDTAGTAIDTHLSLSKASMSFGEYVLPLDTVTVSAGLHDGVLDVSEGTITALGGTARVTMKQWLAGSDSGRFEMQGEGQDLDIEQALHMPPGVEPKVTGDLDFHVQTGGSFEDLAKTFSGSGNVYVDKGHFSFIDLFRNFLNMKGKRSERDVGTADFELTPDRVRWSNMKLSGDLLGIAGHGDLFYDGSIDYLLAVGPMHGRHGVLGFFGDLIGAVSARIIAYRVTGTVDDPKIEVAPLQVAGVKGNQSDTDDTNDTNDTDDTGE